MTKINTLLSSACDDIDIDIASTLCSETKMETISWHSFNNRYKVMKTVGDKPIK